MDIHELLQVVVDENASDLHLVVGKPPVIRIDGRMESLDLACLSAEETERLMKSITSEEHQQKVQEAGSVDFGFAFGQLARFRVNIYKQKGYYSLALRQIPSRLLSLEEIGLPSNIKDFLFKSRGLILVTGPAGSGKTTTLATMINIINQEKAFHILTIEDPFEYYHEHKKSIVTQREIGVDVLEFPEALRASLRQNPDVVLVGEMRDLATMEAAISASETGHLVFATLHTIGAAETVDRVIGAFPPNQQEQVRSQLANSLVAVISQLLLPRAHKKGRIAAFELMIVTPSIKSLIRENKTYRITSDIQTGAKYGMITMDNSLMLLYMRDEISYADLIECAEDPEQIALKVKDLKR